MGGSYFASARFSQSLIDQMRNACSDIRIRKRGDLSLRIIFRSRFNHSQSFSQCFADLFCMSGRPDARSVDTGASAIVSNGTDHYVQIIFPVVCTVRTNHYFAVAWAVNLDARVVGPNTCRACVAKDDPTLAPAQNLTGS